MLGSAPMLCAAARIAAPSMGGAVIEEQGKVLRAADGVAIIEAVRRSACGNCGAAGSCGTSLLDRFLGRRPLHLEVDNTLGVEVGDAVVVGVPEDALLRAAAAAYLGPLAGLIGGAIAGRHWPVLGSTDGELASIVGGVLGLVIALRLVAAYSRRLTANRRFRPVLLRRDRPLPFPVTLS
jgi:sigma-E factor negative regulatory protein RseC